MSKTKLLIIRIDWAIIAFHEKISHFMQRTFGIRSKELSRAIAKDTIGSVVRLRTP